MGGVPVPHSQESTCAAMPGMGCCHRQHVLGPWDIGRNFAKLTTQKDAGLQYFYIFLIEI